MNIEIIAMGKIKKGDLHLELMEKYIKRTKWNIQVTELEIKKKLPPAQLIIAEGDLFLSKISAADIIFALDAKGAQLTSEKFAGSLIKTLEQGKKVIFLIGGAFGLDKRVKDRVNEVISLSSMTFTHIMARLFLLEQIYRSYSIYTNHPYNL